MYNTEDKIKLNRWVDDILASSFLRKKYGTTIMHHTNTYSENTIISKCVKCRSDIKYKFGDFSKPLDQKFLSCPNGGLDESHGFWASVINFMMN